MRNHQSFNGFDEIKASDSLKRRLYTATTEHINRGKKRKNITKPIGALVSATVCVIAVVLIVHRMPNETITLPGSEPNAVSSTEHSVPQAQISEEMFQLLAFSPESGKPTEVTLDGVQVIIPNMGPDYHTENINGKEVEVAGGFVCPDLSVSGEGIKSVTYTAENEILMYEDPRAWVTDEGLPTWNYDNYIVPAVNFADPNHPTMEEIIRELEELRKNGELLSLEHNILKTQWAEDFYNRNGKAPDDDDYSELYELYEKFVSVPLDYTQFLIETEVITVDEENSHILIGLLNPENQIDTPIQYGQTVTTRPGELVAYSYSNETFEKMEIKGEYDLTQIRDIIKIEVLFTSGNTKMVYLQVGHDANGVLSMTASESI